MSESLTFNLTWGFHGIFRLMTAYNGQFKSVLDIGAGPGEHTRFFRLFGKDAFSVDLHEAADYVGDIHTAPIDRKFDLVWCSHVLEHQRNVGQFLERIYDLIEDGGWLGIAVPVHESERLVAGHVTVWNAGLLIYHLVLAGFDCAQAAFIQHYDLSLIVQKRAAQGPDVRAPAAYLPLDRLQPLFPVPAGSTFAKTIVHNWDTNYVLPSVGRPVRLRIENKIIGPIETVLE